jgi:proteasome accessory factor B
MVPISEAELVSVFVAQQSLAPYEGTSLEAPLKSAFQKLVSSLDGELSVEWESLQQAISIRGAEAKVSDAGVFQELSGAVRKGLEVEFEYRKLQGAEGGGKREDYKLRRVRPYHLACIRNVWYLFGFDLGRKDTRTFVLSRMRRVRVTEARFEKPKGFSVEKMLRGSFGVFAGKGLKKMRVRFDAWAAQLIRERKWHHSQRLSELPGGGIEVELELSSTVEVVQWILSWGEHARVVAPRELVEEVKRRVERTRAVYR